MEDIKEQIFVNVKILREDHEVTELRMLHTPKGTLSGYYDNVEKLAQDAADLDADVPGIYMTANPCIPSLLARSTNRLTPYAKYTTRDNEIVSRSYLPIDLDPVRPVGISATDEEHERALSQANVIKKFLLESEWPGPIEGDSGNGAYLLYKIDLANDESRTDLIRDCLDVLDFQFSDECVAVDTSMFNAARIIRLFGTTNCKGDPTEDRPHRRSKLIGIPNAIQTVTEEQLKALAIRKPTEPKNSHKNSSLKRVNVTEFCENNGLQISKIKPWRGKAHIYELQHCPFNGEHVRSSGITQFASGAVAFRCFHNSCRSHNWQTLKELLGHSEEVLFCAGPYEMREDGIIWNKSKKDETVPVRLTNFQAKITADIAKDDGAEVQTAYEIEASVHGRKAVFHVPAAQFPSLSWVASQLGAQAITSPGPAIKDHARAAIQHLSPDIEHRRIYQHTGWRKLDAGIWTFLHAGGALGPDGPVPGIEVSLPPELSRYRLPNPDSERVRLGIKASLRILEIAPDRITVPLFCATWRAPLGDSSFSLFCSGATGSFKSALTALSQQHYGAGMDALHLPASWSSTSNALESLCFAAKDAIVVVDDFIPSGNLGDLQRYHATADRLLRAQGNQIGRQRQRSDGSMRPEKHPRGLIMSSGEDVPQGTSLRARMGIVEVAKDDVDVEKLSRCQKDAGLGLYAMAMSGFIAWLARNYESTHRTLGEKIADLRQQATASGMHRRTPEMIAHLGLGLHYFQAFAVESGAITQSEGEELWEASWKTLTMAAAAQQQHQAASDPPLRFIEIIRTAIACGDAHIASDRGEAPLDAQAFGWRFKQYAGQGEWVPQGTRVGWVKDRTVYLLPHVSFGLAQEFGRKTGEPILLTQVTLGKRLKERKLLLTDKGREDHTTVRVMAEKARHETWGVTVGTLLNLNPDQPDQSYQQHSSNNYNKASDSIKTHFADSELREKWRHAKAQQ